MTLQKLCQFFVAWILAFSIFLLLPIAGCGGASSSSSQGDGGGNSGQPPAAAAPTVASISPATVTVGSGELTLQVKGTGFVASSVVHLNGAALTTTFVSATELTASVPATTVATGATLSVVVVNPDGQSSASGTTAVQLTVDNGQPTITLLTPASITAGSPATSVVVTGTNFVPASVASFGGNPRPTTVQSATQLTVAVTADDLATSASIPITVTTPAPGGGTSQPSPLAIISATGPAITAISPSSVVAGSGNTLLTVTGSGFTAQSTVSLSNVGSLATTYVSPTTLTATIPAMAITAATSLEVQVNYPIYGSNLVPFTVTNPVLSISAISPAVVTCGADTFDLSIYATGLTGFTQVLVNGVPRASQRVTGAMTTSIYAQDVATVGSLAIQLNDGDTSGVSSQIVDLNCIAGDTRLRSANLTAHQIVWDPAAQHIYAAIAASSGTDANDVVAIDPITGSVVASHAMAGEPTLLSMTGDQQYLYVAMSHTGNLARLKLPSLALDTQWSSDATQSSGPTGSISDIQAAPGLPHTVAVVQVEPGGGSQQVLAIYDDGVRRAQTGAPPSTGLTSTVLDKVQWGADATVLYGVSTTLSGGVELTFDVNASGATLSSSGYGVFNSFSPIFYDAATTHIFDDYGNVVDSATNKLIGQYPGPSGLNTGSDFAVDSTLGRVYFVGGPNGTSGNTQIQVYDQQTFLPTDTISLWSTGGGGTDLIRWGSAGLAFIDGANIYFVDGPFVAPGVPAASATGDYAVQAPRLSALSPISVPTGTPDTTVTITGQGFTEATAVTWNGNYLAATLLSPTQMQVTIPAAALDTPTAGSVIALNDPFFANSNPLTFTVTPDLETGMQFTVLNVPGQDMVWNSTAGQLYVSVPGSDPIRGNSLVSIDPAAGIVKSMLPVASNPYVLAISPDNQYLYTGFGGSAVVQRFALPALTPDLTIPLGVGDLPNSAGPGSVGGCDFAVSIGVAPGAPQTIAVSQGADNVDPSGCGPVVIFDGSVARSETLPFAIPDYSNLVWGASGTALYAQQEEGSSPQYLSVLAVSPTGVSLVKNLPNNVYLGYQPHFLAETGYIYSDGGPVTDPVSGAVVGNFMASGLMVPDYALGRAFFLGQTQDQLGSVSYTLQIFDLKTYALLDSMVIPAVSGLPAQMVRWGTSGLAFTTSGQGLTYILSGPRFTGAGGSNSQADPGAEHVRLTWNPRRGGPSAAPAVR